MHHKLSTVRGIFCDACVIDLAQIIISSDSPILISSSSHCYKKLLLSHLSLLKLITFLMTH